MILFWLDEVTMNVGEGLVLREEPFFNDVAREIVHDNPSPRTGRTTDGRVGNSHMRLPKKSLNQLPLQLPHLLLYRI